MTITNRVSEPPPTQIQGTGLLWGAVPEGALQGPDGDRLFQPHSTWSPQSCFNVWLLSCGGTRALHQDFFAVQKQKLPTLAPGPRRTAGRQCFSETKRGQKAKGFVPAPGAQQLVGAGSSDKGMWVLLIHEAVI